MIAINNLSMSQEPRAYVPKSYLPNEDKFIESCGEVGGQYDKDHGNCIITTDKIAPFMELLRKNGKG